MGTFLMWSRGDSFNVVQQAIAEKAQTLAFTYGGVADNRPREKLAEKLQQWAPRGMGETRIFFCSGGARLTRRRSSSPSIPVPLGTRSANATEGNRAVAELPRKHDRYTITQ